MKKVLLFIIFIVLSSILVFGLETKLSADPKTAEIFSVLKTTDSLKAEAIFTLDTSKEAEPLTKESFRLEFKEVCGRVKSYTFQIKDICFETIPIYDKVTDNKTEPKILSYEYLPYDCYKEINTLPVDVKDYKIKADIERGLCSDGYMGYKIDWIPVLTIDKTDYKMDSWAWWNASGGSTYYDGLYTVHTFTSNGTLTVNGTFNATVLIIAGGGAGGGMGGGGGAGGFSETNMTLTNGSYSVIVGAGAVGVASAAAGLNGSNSSFNNIVMAGGGGGGGDGTVPAKGGSGGGKGNGAGSGANGTTGQGFSGGSTLSAGAYAYSGGGGSAEAGVDSCGSGACTVAGRGGTGLNTSINGSLACFAGGGGGGGYLAGTAGTANCGGGLGAMSGAASIAGYDAIPNSGGGGGGSGLKTSYSKGGDGGSGVVIIRYLTASAQISVSFISQNPSDILSTTLFSQNVNITYDYSGFTSWQNYLNYTVISSELSCIEYANGTCEVLNNTRRYSFDATLNNTRSSFILDENDLLPHVDLWDSITDGDLWNAPKTNVTLGNDNSYLSMTYKNLSALQYGFLELFASSNDALGGRVYACNDSYDFASNPDTNAYCYLFNSFSGTAFNHTHGLNSSHKVIVMPFNVLANKIGTVSLSPKMHIIIRGRNSASVRIRTANFYSGLGIVKTTSNNGGSWSNQVYTPDSHIHQFGLNDLVSYFGCANDTGVVTCDSTVKSDNYDLTLLSPTVPDVYSPTNTTYLFGTDISINYTASISPNSGGYVYYNISLLNNDTSFNQTINANVSVLGFQFNTSNLSRGYYYVKVEAIDNYGQSSFGLSQKFLYTLCLENWNLTVYDSCGTDDLMLKTYVDASSCGTIYSLPADNGTFEACNYCTEDLVESSTACIDGIQTVSYDDLNFIDCCFVTSLESDCSILYTPYNIESRVNCTVPTSNVTACDDYNLTVNFSCRYDPYPLLKDKMNVVCLMPDNESYECVVNVFQNTNLLATTPEYKEATDSLINLKPQTDTRTFFTPEKRLLNAFYTSKSIVTDTPFVVEVLCSSMTKDIITEVCVTPEYEGQTWILGRSKWVSDNGSLLIWIIISALIVAGILFYVVKVARSGY